MGLSRNFPCPLHAYANIGGILKMANTPIEPNRPKLLDQARIAMRQRHYSLKTEKSYVSLMKRYILLHNKCASGSGLVRRGRVLFRALFPSPP